MNWVITRNNRIIKLKDIPVLNIDDFIKEIIASSKEDKRVVGFFGNKVYDKVILYVVMADDEKSKLLITSTVFESKVKSYPSITQCLPSFHVFEREFYEEFGIEPLNHPWLKPVRYSHDRNDKSQKIENYPFFKMEGDKIHEVAVGPVHAGIIEPGHFRFMCNGEDVYHLEVQLGYQHRGIEKLFLDSQDDNKPNFKVQLAESIAGDSVVAHSTSYAALMETLGNVEISKRAMAIRAIALEMERIGIHIGDIGAIANDIAYLTGNAVYGATRTLLINTLLSICGSRFGRGLIRVGGVIFNIDKVLKDRIKTIIKKVDHDISDMTDTMLTQSTVLARLEQTGVLTREDAIKIGMVGPAARASGLTCDVRADHPFGIYRYIPVYPFTLDSGDVYARTYIRYIEIKQSIRFINELLDNFPRDKILIKPVKQLAKNSMAISMVEGWRGEIAHIAITDKEGKIIRYKIKDPSFCDWYGLVLAVRNNGISDFPLCNKSFNLSYSGHDL